VKDTCNCCREIKFTDLLIIVIPYAQLAITKMLYHTGTDFCSQLINKPECRDKPGQILRIRLQIKIHFLKVLNYVLWTFVILLLITGGYSWY